MKEKNIEIAKLFITKENRDSDPIYKQIEQWYLDDVPIETIKERIDKYIMKKSEKKS